MKKSINSISLLEAKVKQVLTESTKLKFAGYTFLLKVDVNDDPQKKGLKVQLIPTEFGAMNVTKQNDIAIEFESRLEKGLAEYGLRVERDRALKDKTIIGFFIYIEFFDRIIRKALESQNPGNNKLEEKPEEPKENAGEEDEEEKSSAFPTPKPLK